MKPITKQSILVLCLISILVISCMCVPSGLPTSSRPEVTAPSARTSQPDTVLPSEPSTPNATAQPSPEGKPDNGLNATGPWLLISTESDLWALNPDGSNPTRLVSSIVGSTSLQSAIQPGIGNKLAVITSGGDQIYKLALNLLSMPDGKLIKLTDLTSPQNEPGEDSGPGDPGFEAIRAITERNALAWSPDGSKLAFIGFLQGTSADVYLYDTQNGKISRIGKDSAQDFGVSWSPDGKYILHFGVESFGTGAGVSMKGVWATHADGSSSTMLYEPKDSSGEELIGWMPNSHQALLSSWSMICGSSNLRLYDVENVQKTVLAKDCFNQAAISPSGDILYGDSSQVYMLKAGSKKSKSILPGEATQIYWSPDDYTFILRFSDASLMTYVDFDGEVHQQKAPQTGMGSVASYGAIWAWSSYSDKNPGVWITGPGITTSRIFMDKASTLVWSPDNTLIFFGGNSIYRATFPLYKDVKVMSDFESSVQQVKWMGKSE